MVERRLFELNMTVDMIFLIHDGALNKAIDDMTRRGVLYILVVQQQHEEHKSITVNIMHGTPQGCNLKKYKIQGSYQTWESFLTLGRWTPHKPPFVLLPSRLNLCNLQHT